MTFTRKQSKHRLKFSSKNYYYKPKRLAKCKINAQHSIYEELGENTIIAKNTPTSMSKLKIFGKT